MLESHARISGITALLLAILLLGGLAAPAPARADAADRPLIIEAGRPRAQIVIAADAPPTVRIAADDLQVYLEKATGARLPLRTAPQDDLPLTIYVGQSSFTDALGVSAGGLEHGAFRTRSDDRWLILLGGDAEFVPPEPHAVRRSEREAAQKQWEQLTGETWGHPFPSVFKSYSRELDIWEHDGRGTLNAVHDFLRSLGVRWYFPGELGEVVPQLNQVELPAVDKTVTPDFATRHVYFYGQKFFTASPEEIRWQLRQGINSGYSTFGIGSRGHGIDYVHNQPATIAAHPEYYLLAGGTRKTEGESKPCLGNPGLAEANIAFLRAVFDRFDPQHFPVFSVMPADGYTTLCQCDYCKDQGTPQRGYRGQISDYVFRYVNNVASALYQSHPERTISLMGYGAYQLPPLKIDRFTPNVIFGHTMARRLYHDEATFQQIQALRDAWMAKIAHPDGKLWIWEHHLHTKPTNSLSHAPVYMAHPIARDLRSLEGRSYGDFIEWYRETGDDLGAFVIDHYNFYITSRLWWDADQDLEALIDDYCRTYFGPASEPMRRFIDWSEANWPRVIEDADSIDTVFELLAAGQKSVASDTIHGRRIARIGEVMAPLRDLQEKLRTPRAGGREARLPLVRGQDVTVDGKLDEAIWDKVPARGLRELATGRSPAIGTTFRMFWMNGALYIGIHCDEPEPGVKGAAGADGDMNIFSGNAVELLFETQNHVYYQIALSPEGHLVDIDRQGGFETLWSVDGEVAASRGDGYWALEMRLPVAGSRHAEENPLGGIAGDMPTSNRPWYFNLCRQRRTEHGVELSAFSPTGRPTFHDREAFARLWVD